MQMTLSPFCTVWFSPLTVLHWKKLGISPSYGARFKGVLRHGYRDHLILFVQGLPSSGGSQYGGQVRISSCVVLILTPNFYIKTWYFSID